MDSRPVVFYDSGVGGLPYLAWIRDRLPNEGLVYVADNANFPYGEKDPDDLRSLVVSAMGEAIDRFDPKLAVVACNTASVVALSALRANYPLPFVGVVPAVKPAAEGSRRRRIALLATTRTVGDAYSERLIEKFASDCTVVRIAGSDLVTFVETEYLDATPDRIRAALEPTIAPLRYDHVDSIVLGCTHFTFLDREFADAFGGDIRIIDSREGVGRQVMKLLRERGLASESKREGMPPPASILVHTAPDGGRYARYAERFKLSYGGVIS